MLRGLLRQYVTRTTPTSNAQAAPCLSARTFMSRTFHLGPTAFLFSSLLPFFSADSCSGENCASECTGANCGSTLPVPPLLRHASHPLFVCPHFHATCFSFQVLITALYYILPLLPLLFTRCCIFRGLLRRELRQQVHGVFLRQYVTRTTLHSPRKPSAVCLLAPHVTCISFQSTDECCIIFCSSVPFSFHPMLHLQVYAQARTAPASALLNFVAVRHIIIKLLLLPGCYVTRTTLIPNTQAIPCLPARTITCFSYSSADECYIFCFPLLPFLLCCIFRVLRRR